MDLAYLRANPHLLLTFMTHQRLRTTPVAGGSICSAERITLDDGTDLLLKTWPGGVSGSPTEERRSAPPGLFAAEARGLRWLRDGSGVSVPELIAATDELLLMEWIEHGKPTPAAAERFGRELAATHRAGAPTFGAADDGYLGNLALDNTPGEDWAPWYLERRILPYLRLSVDNGAFDPTDAARIAGIWIEAPDEPPARLHGDLWPGNIIWGADDTPWLVDPAAYGGHRESDLATLFLFGGAPHLETILASYHEAWPLADGWRDRIALHQLHLLLAHTALFGVKYRSAVLRATRQYM
ncbi:fructosamine kinase [Longispora fulva]|uniref:Fructosamine-3-kinase n=1 Tax=Longispora fulva TaxID=619741 RepID=A0A8J7GM59_9ACTN|nr:fructosamine kinase family protein [Longispora fulva]MBG6139522.1 fructosamine-3-kinase [Longispora fulva]GIG58095.1 fructosamine kinase [Longispora fulva]